MILQAWTSNLHKQICAQLSFNCPNQNFVNTTIHVRMSDEQLNTFKTEYCYNRQIKSNPQYDNIHHSMESPYFYNCSYYHSQKDRRRQVYLNANNKSAFQYSSTYISDDFDKQTCQNWIQYLFHPQIYKTKQCQNPLCQRRFCPKYHKVEQKHEKSPILKVAQQNKIQSSINSIKQLKKLSSIDQCQDVLIRQQMKKIQQKICSYSERLIKYQQQEANKVIHLKNEIRNLVNTTVNQGEVKNKNASKNVKQIEQQYDTLFYNEQLKIMQDRQHQFKMFKDKDPRRISAMVLQYISAFLNSDGGSIYLGINDESIVHGLDVTQKWLDQFKLAVDSDGRDHLNPPLIPQKYDLRIIPVKHPKKLDLKVIQIKVFPQNQQEKKILTLFKKQCYLRMNASNHRLSASDIMQYMRLANTKKSLQQLQNKQEQIERLTFAELKQLQQNINKINLKITNTLRKKQNQQESQVDKAPQ